MKEIKYQIKYINKLANVAKELLTDKYRDNGTIVFKAPTGSGKTYMVSQALTQLVKDNPEISFAFIWISVNNLHEQSLNSLSRYFEDEQLLDCITNTDLNNNTIVLGPTMANMFKVNNIYNSYYKLLSLFLICPIIGTIMVVFTHEFVYVEDTFKYRYVDKEFYYDSLIIDDYFNVHGYKTNRVKMPNITGRLYWNYVQIADQECIGYSNTTISVPTKSMEIINNVYRRGVTIWHNHDNIGNYSLNNTIVN